MKELTIYAIITDNDTYITDCQKMDGYDYRYHRSKLKDLYFDGKEAEHSFLTNWYKVKRVTDDVSSKRIGERTNERYVLKNKDMQSDKMPLVIACEDSHKFDIDMLDVLYQYKWDRKPDYFEKVAVNWEILAEVEDFVEPGEFRFNAIEKRGFSDRTYSVTRKNIEHQVLDSLQFPELLLHGRPCKLSSRQMYDITRQHIIENIDPKVAKITSNYDFCFTVKKLIPIAEPKAKGHHDLSTRTKEGGNKGYYQKKRFDTVEVFEMTHADKCYSGYTVISSMVAPNEETLKEKVNDWLDYVINVINTPLTYCPDCNGTGYVGEIQTERADRGYCKAKKGEEKECLN